MTNCEGALAGATGPQDRQGQRVPFIYFKQERHTKTEGALVIERTQGVQGASLNTDL